MDERMAFDSIVEGTLRMNAKMLEMGQSIDIQKMPRPKAGTRTAQKKIQYIPEGSEIERILYPKNFRAREITPDETIIAKKEEKTMIENSTEQETTPTAEENSAQNQTQEKNIIETEENQENGTAIIENELPIENMPKTEEIKKEKSATVFSQCTKPAWENCKHYKAQGNRTFCREYMGWCAKEKCTRPKY